MISARSLANQKLYHARILTGSWRSGLQAQQIPATILAQAFEQAVREHLRLAYAWFLLAITQPATLPEVPPGSCFDLPDIAEGKAIPGEIRELQRLEKGGWLADMLSREAPQSQSPNEAASLAVSVSSFTSPDQVDEWVSLLESTFDRMSDFLDEY